MKIWIDTDIGGDIDDALALLLAMASEEVELVGVSTVFENTAARAKIAKSLLNMGGLTHVPVYAGEGYPLAAKSVYDNPVNVSKLPKTYSEVLFGRTEYDKKNAVEAMKTAFLESDGEIILVALGALTNIAKLIKRYPEAAEKIKGVYIMGGAAERNWNEFNLTCDPEAADIVFSSQLPKKIVTLDVTFRCRFSSDQIRRMANCQSKAVKTVMQMSALWGEGMILHDPLTLAVVLSDEFVRFEEGNLLVELSGEYSRGKCVNFSDFNWRRKPRPDMLVSVDVEEKKLLDFYIDRICNMDRLLCGELRKIKK